MIRRYRFSVRSFLPRIAYAETVLHRNGFPPDTPGPELDRLIRELAQSEFENGWDPYRKHAGIGTYSLAGLIVILPKVGVLSDLAIRGPNPQTEALYVRSVNRSIDALRQALVGGPQVVPNRDLDTGAEVRPESYRLTDETYARLLRRITKVPDWPVLAGLKRDVEAYYADPAAPISTRRNAAKWAEVESDLVTLKGMPEIPEP